VCLQGFTAAPTLTASPPHWSWTRPHCRRYRAVAKAQPGLAIWKGGLNAMFDISRLSILIFVPAGQFRSGGPDQTYFTSTRYMVPGGSDELNACFYRNEDGKCQFAVLRYGWFQDLIEWSGDRVVPEVKIDGNKTPVPLDGAVYVVDPALRLHRIAIAAEDLKTQLDAPQFPGGFFETRLWQDAILPVAKQHAWQRPAKK